TGERDVTALDRVACELHRCVDAFTCRVQALHHDSSRGSLHVRDCRVFAATGGRGHIDGHLRIRGIGEGLPGDRRGRRAPPAAGAARTAVSGIVPHRTTIRVAPNDAHAGPAHAGPARAGPARAG